MKDLAEFAASRGLGGLEFLHGIPGSVGGGVYMNAGAYEREMRDIFVSARCISKSNMPVEHSLDDMSFSYRKSLAQTEGLVVVSAIFQGILRDNGEIAAKMQDLGEQRSSKQPLESPSAGSIFKRPPGRFAGKLIADAGLRGHIIGGAQVSEKHCGFIINRGNATAADILALISHIQQTVQDKFGIWLETEVKIIGE
jgi:UDP-N-acetylmuramate dehydrogenase